VVYVEGWRGFEDERERRGCAADTSFQARKRLANLRLTVGVWSGFPLATDCMGPRDDFAVTT
jgi:hypothetical protein